MESKVRKSILDGGREYLKGCTELDVDWIYISTTAYYMLEENTREERMDRTVTTAVRTMLINSVHQQIFELSSSMLYARQMV